MPNAGHRTATTTGPAPGPKIDSGVGLATGASYGFPPHPCPSCAKQEGSEEVGCVTCTDWRGARGVRAFPSQVGEGVALAL
eukprot:885750-Rhodomonas_salina.2